MFPKSQFWIGYGVVSVLAIASAALVGDKGILTLVLTALAANIASVVLHVACSGLKVQLVRGLVVAGGAIAVGGLAFYLIARFI